MNIDMLFEKQKTTDDARKFSKKWWGNRSVLDDRSKKELIEDGDSLDAAHLYPAGETKYKHIAKLPANIFPMPHLAHLTWDTWLIHEKVSMLIDNCCPEKRMTIVEIIDRLQNEI